VSRSDEVAADDTTPELSAEQDRAAADEGTAPAEQASGARGPVDDAADDGADADADSARDAGPAQDAGSVQGGDRTEDGRRPPRVPRSACDAWRRRATSPPTISRSCWTSVTSTATSTSTWTATAPRWRSPAPISSHG